MINPDNLVFFFNDTATTEIYTLSLHDALPIWDFVDQFFRDINQIGYPSSRLVDTTSLTWSPVLMPQATYTWANTYIFDNRIDRKSTRLNSSHQIISYAVFCLKKTNCKR